jgi:prevent-host-death family protein
MIIWSLRMKTWNATEAKQYFSKVIDSVVDEPQIVLRRGKPVGVVISYSDFVQNRSLTEDQTVSHWLLELDKIRDSEADMDEIIRVDRTVSDWD